MNSGGASGSSRGGLSPLSRQQEIEDSAGERGREEAAALWVALAQQVQSSHNLALPGDPPAQIEPPSAWHSSAGNLTPGGAVAGGAEGAPPAPERLVLRVDGGSLGELEVTLDRQDGALRVVIGMENQHLVGAVLPDARALKSALEQAGVSVQSLNVVPASEVGTVLAQRRVSQSKPKLGAEEGAEQQENEKAQKRNQKRLTLIG